MTDTPDTPRKTLTLKRKPSDGSQDAANKEAEDKTVRSTKLTGKRVIRREGTKQKPSSVRPSQNTKKKAPTTTPAKTTHKAPSPSELRAKSFDKLLHEAYPVWHNYQPLILGIEAELYALMTSEHPPASKRVLQRLLRMHCRHGKYLQALLEGTERYTLTGEIGGEVTQAEREYAQRTLDSYENT